MITVLHRTGLANDYSIPRILDYSIRNIISIDLTKNQIYIHEHMTVSVFSTSPNQTICHVHRPSPSRPYCFPLSDILNTDRSRFAQQEIHFLHQRRVLVHHLLHRRPLRQFDAMQSDQIIVAVQSIDCYDHLLGFLTRNKLIIRVPDGHHAINIVIGSRM